MKIVELRQNRSLINPNFQGYKLSLDSIAALKQELNIPPLISRPSDEEYSYFHAELFSLHNYLIQDHWSENDNYFINQRGDIMKSSYDKTVGKPHKNLYTMYKLNISHRKSGDYPIAFQFISCDLCILSDGTNEILLLDTGDRTKSTEWKCIFKVKITEFQNCIIRDCRLNVGNNNKTISCILQHIRKKEDDSGYINELVHCIITWNMEEENNIWEFTVENTLIAKGSLNYCAFESSGKFLVLCGSKGFKSKNALEDEEKLKNENLEKERENTSLPYSWIQTENDVTIRFKKSNINQKNFRIITTTTKLTIWSSGEILFDKELFGKINSDLTTWTWSNDYLELILMKENESLHWTCFAADGDELSENSNASTLSNFNQPPIANLESQIEDCDFPLNDIEEDYKIVRVDLNTLEQTHIIFLGKYSPLFNTYLQTSLSSSDNINPPAIVTRQDIDACIWTIEGQQEQECDNINQQQIINVNDQWFLKHEGNLHAFGYVQASKQQKKFINCSPNLQYAIICETQRHVFIYKLNSDNDNVLRKRNAGPKVDVGIQHVVVLDDNPDVYGLSTKNSYTAILTEKNIVYLQVNSN